MITRITTGNYLFRSFHFNLCLPDAERTFRAGHAKIAKGLDFYQVRNRAKSQCVLLNRSHSAIVLRLEAEGYAFLFFATATKTVIRDIATAKREIQIARLISSSGIG